MLLEPTKEETRKLIDVLKVSTAVILYGLLHEQGRWAKPWTVTGYPSRQDGCYLAYLGLPAVSCKKIQSNLSIFTPLWYQQFPMYWENSNKFLKKTLHNMGPLENRQLAVTLGPGSKLIQTLPLYYGHSGDQVSIIYVSFWKLHLQLQIHYSVIENVVPKFVCTACN